MKGKQLVKQEVVRRTAGRSGTALLAAFLLASGPIGCNRIMFKGDGPGIVSQRLTEITLRKYQKLIVYEKKEKKKITEQIIIKIKRIYDDGVLFDIQVKNGEKIDFYNISEADGFYYIKTSSRIIAINRNREHAPKPETEEGRRVTVKSLGKSLKLERTNRREAVVSVAY